VFLHPKVLLALLKRTYAQFSKDKVPRMGAALAYYTIFSLAPLLIIAIGIAGFVFGRDAAQGSIVGQISNLVGPESGRAIQAMLQSAREPAPGIVASILGIATLLLGATGVFAEIQDALNTIWSVETPPRNGIWNLVRARFLSLSMVLAIGFLLLVSLLLSATLAAVSKYIGGFLPGAAGLLHVIDFLISFVVIMILFATIFKVLPDARIAWGDVWAGAGLTAFLFTVGKFLIGFYIGKTVSASIYGAAGSLVLLVAWIYYSGIILYFGAEFTHAYCKECGSRMHQLEARQPKDRRQTVRRQSLQTAAQ
jgi:membrane protein